MIIINEIQGSQGWLDVRVAHFTASEAPQMMGASKYGTRTALLKQKHTGIAPEIDAITQRRFDAGHAAETAARLLVEAEIGQELFPSTGTLEVEGLPLLASFDGITMRGDIIWESKQWNAALADQVRSGQLDPHYYWQIEQQLLVSGAKRAYFTTTDGTPENLVGMWYESVPKRRTAIVSGWHQFAADLFAYQHVEAVVEPVAAPVMSLPAITYRLNGLALTSNLDEYRAAAERLVEDSKKKLETDEDFVNQDAMNKAFKEAEERIALVCEQVIGEIRDVDAFTRELSHVGELIRQARLNGEKQVKTRKDAIRAEIQAEGEKSLREHIDSLNKLIGKNYMPDMKWADFAGVMRGKKSVASLRDAVNTELANCKIASSAACQLILTNLSSLRDLADGFQFLFADTAQIVLKQTDDLVALVKLRIAEHKDEQARKAEREYADRLQNEQAAARAAEAAEALKPPAHLVDKMVAASMKGDAIIIDPTNQIDPVRVVPKEEIYNRGPTKYAFYVDHAGDTDAGMRAYSDAVVVSLDSGDPGGLPGEFQEHISAALAEWFDGATVKVHSDRAA